MASLNITKVAVGCGSLEDLRARLEGRAAGGEVRVLTRYKPTRAAELIGGSLFWIIKHRLVTRQAIIGFAETEDGKCAIRLDARCVPIVALPRRAHQGWRYLPAGDAPPDLDGGYDLSAMPPRLVEELSALALI